MFSREQFALSLDKVTQCTHYEHDFKRKRRLIGISMYWKGVQSYHYPCQKSCINSSFFMGVAIF